MDWNNNGISTDIAKINYAVFLLNKKLILTASFIDSYL